MGTGLVSVKGAWFQGKCCLVCVCVVYFLLVIGASPKNIRCRDKHHLRGQVPVKLSQTCLNLWVKPHSCSAVFFVRFLVKNG